MLIYSSEDRLPPAYGEKVCLIIGSKSRCYVSYCSYRPTAVLHQSRKFAKSCGPLAGGALLSRTQCPRMHHLLLAQVVLSNARCSVDAKHSFSSGIQHCIRLQMRESRDPPCNQSTSPPRSPSLHHVTYFISWQRLILEHYKETENHHHRRLIMTERSNLAYF